jgi:hypothetical protein
MGAVSCENDPLYLMLKMHSIVEECICKIASWQNQVSSSACNDCGVIFLKNG